MTISTSNKKEDENDDDLAKPLVDLLWINKMDYMLSDNKKLDKFHVVNRIRSKLSDVLDMSHLRILFFRV